jgi:hydrogenase maturation protease
MSDRGPVVIGVGNVDRGDDAVGLLVAREAAAALPDVHVVELADVSDALSVWIDHDFAVVVDAVCTGAEPGSVQVLDLTSHPVPAREAGAAGTHALGLAQVVELARALGRLPLRLVLVGVEARRFGPGDPCDPRVSAAVAEACHRVELLVGADRGDA